MENRAGYNSAGRARGSYLYLVLCSRPPTDVYAKLGADDNPLRRLGRIIDRPPAKPGILATLELPNRSMCCKVIEWLNSALADQRSDAEWFKFAIAQQPWFNQKLQAALSDLHLKSWPLQWAKMSIPNLLAHQLATERAKKRAMRRSPLAYQDFKRHGG